MHPLDYFTAYDRHYRALYTMLYALRGYKPTAEMHVEAQFVKMILPRIKR